MLPKIVQNLLRNPLFMMSATALGILLLSATLFGNQNRSLLDVRTEHYGKALASMAAGQATDATLNHDLVSLQVTVRDVARNPDVLNATIHDVENRLLVQAGDSPNTGDFLHRQTRSYTAAITLHDSVAGYVTVTIDTQRLLEQQDDAWLLGLVAMAAVLLIMSLLNLRSTETGSVAQMSPAGDDKDEDTVEPPNLPARPPIHSGSINIALELVCLNVEKLQQQLSGTLRQQLYQELESTLEGINVLYHCRIDSADSYFLRLHFNGDDLDSTGFRAVCAAQLLYSLLSKGDAGISLQYAGAIYRVEGDSTLQGHMEQSRFRNGCQRLLAQGRSEQLWLHRSDCAADALLQRLKLGDLQEDEEWFTVEGLQPSYQDLLNKQAEQLGKLKDAS